MRGTETFGVDTETPFELYLNLLKETLLGSIYRDPPMDPWCGVVKNEKGEIVEFGKVAGTFFIEPGKYDEKTRDKGLDWPATAHTMIGRRRLDELEDACTSALYNGVPGDFVETGVWRGGASIFMAGVLKAFMGLRTTGVLAANGDIASRRVFVCDSFEGLPPPNPEKYPADKNDFHFMVAPLLAVGLDQVRDNFARYDLLSEQVVFVKGWFKDTLPDLDTNKIAVLRLDGDMYESTWDALTALYSRVSPGGIVLIDDYNAVKGCREAVDVFRREHGVKEPLEIFYDGGAQWRKES